MKVSVSKEGLELIQSLQSPSKRRSNSNRDLYNEKRQGILPLIDANPQKKSLLTMQQSFMEYTTSQRELPINRQSMLYPMKFLKKSQQKRNILRYLKNNELKSSYERYEDASKSLTTSNKFLSSRIDELRSSVDEKKQFQSMKKKLIGGLRSKRIEQNHRSDKLLSNFNIYLYKINSKRGKQPDKNPEYTDEIRQIELFHKLKEQNESRVKSDRIRNEVIKSIAERNLHYNEQEGLIVKSELQDCNKKFQLIAKNTLTRHSLGFTSFNIEEHHKKVIGDVRHYEETIRRLKLKRLIENENKDKILASVITEQGSINNSNF